MKDLSYELNQADQIQSDLRKKEIIRKNKMNEHSQPEHINNETNTQDLKLHFLIQALEELVLGAIYHEHCERN